MGKSKFLHCPYCTKPFGSAGRGWPKKCQECGEPWFKNPPPVVVGLVQVVMKFRIVWKDSIGLVIVKRKIEPAKGKWVLPGGYMEIRGEEDDGEGVGETWQEALARELEEEPCVECDPKYIVDIRHVSIPNKKQVILFGRVAAIPEENLPPFVENDEVSDRRIITEPEELGFSTHTEIVSDFFNNHPRIRG